MIRLYLFMLITFLSFVGGDNVYLPLSPNETVTIMGILSLGFLSLNLVRRKTTPGKRLHSTKLSVFLLLFYAWSALGVFHTVDLGLSFYAAMKYGTAIILTLGLILYIKEQKQVVEILWVLVACAAIHSLFAIIQQDRSIMSALHGYLEESFAKNHQTNQQLWEASLSTFFNANFFSGYLVMNLPIGIYLFGQCREKRAKVVAGIFSVLILLGLGFSGSPGGQAVAFLQLAAATGYALGRNKLKKIALPGALFAGLTLVALATVLLLKGTAGKTGDGKPADSPHQIVWNWDNILSRVVYWQGAWEIFKDHPVAGSGPLTFIALYPKAIAKVEPVARPRYIQKAPPHAHSLYMQTLSDSGLAGFALLIILLTALLKKLARLVKNRDHPHRDMTFYLGLAAGGFLIHNVIEYNWLVSLFVYYFTVVVLLIDFVGRTEDGASHSSVAGNTGNVGRPPSTSP